MIEGSQERIRVMYVNVYHPFAGQSGSAYETRELADQMAARDRIACVEVMYMDGEGLQR